MNTLRGIAVSALSCLIAPLCADLASAEGTPLGACVFVNLYTSSASYTGCEDPLVAELEAGYCGLLSHFRRLGRRRVLVSRRRV